MKKLMKSLMLFAAAAMALTSCDNEGMNEGIESNDAYTLTFVADAPQSRTSVNISGDSANFSWSAEETFVVVASDNSTTKNVTYTKDGDKAVITATFAEAPAEGSTYAAVYPASAWADDNNNAAKAKLILPERQDLTKGTYDPKADLMFSKAVAAQPNETNNLQFTRLAAVGVMNLKGVTTGETIQSVTFTIGDASTKFTGRYYVDLTTSALAEEAPYYGTNSVELINGSLEANVEGTAIYFTCLPGEYSGAYTIEVTTNEAIYRNTGKSITTPLVFTAGNVTRFNAGAGERTAAVDYSGTYLVVTKRSSGDFYYLAPTNGNNSTRLDAVTTNVNEVESVDTSAAEYAWTVEKVEVEENVYYTFKSADNKYLSTDGIGNRAKVVDEVSVSDVVYMTIAPNTDGKTFNINSVEPSGRTLALNESSSYNYFAFYTGSQIKDLYLLPYEVDERDVLATPVVSASVEGKTVTATWGNVEGAGSYEVTVGETTTTVETNTHSFEGDYNSNYTISVVALPANAETHKKSAAGEATAKIGADPEAGSSVPASETFDLSTNNTNKATTSEISWLSDYVEIKNTQGTGGTAANNYYGGDSQSRTSTRFYKNSTLTITPQSGATITSVVFTATTTSYASALKNSTWTNASSSVSSTTVTVTPTNGATAFSAAIGATCGFTEIVVNYAGGNAGGEGGDTPVVETLATPTGLEAIAVGKDVTIAWNEVANATSYYVTCGTQNATVTATEADFTMDEYDITYEISVVAKADGYNDSVAATTTVTTEADPNEGGGEGGGEGGESVEVLSEEFDNSNTTMDGSAISTSTFDNFSGTLSAAYKGFGGVKLGSSKNIGYITSKALDLSSAFTVQLDAGRYKTNATEITVTVGSQTKTITNDQLSNCSAISDALTTITLEFDAATTNSTIKISTTSNGKRAFIDNVIVTVSK